MFFGSVAGIRCEELRSFLALVLSEEIKCKLRDATNPDAHANRRYPYWYHLTSPIQSNLVPPEYYGCR